MKIRKIQTVAAMAAAIAMAMPQAAMAAPAKPAVAKTSAVQGDVALRSGNVFVGQIMSAQGRAVANERVAMVTGGKTIAVTKTDKQGRFAVSGLRAGQYDVVALNGKSTFRAWTPKTAPPSARKGVLIVSGADVLNAQGAGGLLGFVQSYPLMTAAAVTAAIAIPVGIAAADDDPPATP